MIWKHNCNFCGKLVCGTCLKYKLPSWRKEGRKERACKSCADQMKSTTGLEINKYSSNSILEEPSLSNYDMNSYSELRVAIATRDYTSKKPDHLSFKKGDKIHISSESIFECWTGVLHGDSLLFGRFPGDCVETSDAKTPGTPLREILGIESVMTFEDEVLGFDVSQKGQATVVCAIHDMILVDKGLRLGIEVVSIHDQNVEGMEFLDVLTLLSEGRPVKIGFCNDMTRNWSDDEDMLNVESWNDSPYRVAI